MVPLDVWRARMVVEEGPERSVMEEPGIRVWLEIMYRDSAFGVMVSEPMVSAGAAAAGGVGRVRGVVVKIVEPAALVVGRIMAERWVVVEMMAPWALVEVMIVGRDTEIVAVERLGERMMLPWELVEVMMVGTAMAVLVEMVMPPFEPVEVMGTRTATGVVGKVVSGDGEGVMMMLLAAGAGGPEISGSNSFADSRTAGTGATVSVGTIPCAFDCAAGAIIDMYCVAAALVASGADEGGVTMAWGSGIGWIDVTGSNAFADSWTSGT